MCALTQITVHRGDRRAPGPGQSTASAQSVGRVLVKRLRSVGLASPPVLPPRPSSVPVFDRAIPAAGSHLVRGSGRGRGKGRGRGGGGGRVRVRVRVRVRGRDWAIGLGLVRCRWLTLEGSVGCQMAEISTCKLVRWKVGKLVS